MKRILALAAVAALFSAALAETYFYEPPADGTDFTVPGGGRVVWIDGVSTNAEYTPALKIVRESWGTAQTVVAHAATNWSYQVVWTNWVSTNRTDVITNAPTAAIPTYLPDTMTQIITNETVTAWAVTNWVDVLLVAETNAATAGTSYAAPGDKFLLSPAAPDGARVTVGVEN